MKEKVIQLLRNNELSAVERYNEAMALYRRSEGHSVPAANFYNRSGFTEPNLKNLCYDLQKLHGIGDAELRGEKSAKVKMEVVVDEANVDDDKDKIAFPEIPEEAATGLKVREDFPFLNADDCPDKLKILVADRISAWYKYKEAHAELLKHANGEALTDAQILELVQTAVEKFELNKEIWEELNHYKEHGEILGNHAIFADEMLAKAVNAMNVKELMKRQKSLRTYVSRDTKKLETAKDEESKGKIAAKVADWKKELDLVDAKLAEK
jgi:hypothetical protein